MFTQVSSSAGHSLALTKDGYVYGKGSNNFGQLTNSRFQFEPEYTRVTNLTNVVQVVANEQLSMILSRSGDVYYFGLRLDKVQKFPTQIQFNQPIKMIAHGLNHYLFLAEDGTVYGYGKNNFGQLGSIVSEIHDIQKIDNLNNIVKVAAGKDFSLALNDKGHVYVFGNNDCGQLGVGEDMVIINPVRNIYLNKIIDISAADQHSLALSSNDNYLYGFGSNEFGQLAIVYENIKFKRFPTVIAKDVIKITAKNSYSLVENVDRERFVTGVLGVDSVNHWVRLGKISKI